VASVVLIVDDVDWSDPMRRTLEAEGFVVLDDPDGDIAFDDARLRGVDLCVVDLGLRHRSGVAVCAALRARSAVPVVATARIADEATVLSAFSAGADQFAPLATTPRLFVARVRSLLRRVPPGMTGAGEVEVGPVVLHPEQRAAVVNGVVVGLSDQEHEVLRVLLERAGRVVPRADLLVGKGAMAKSDRTLDFVIRRLRQKLETADTRRRITAIRGVGFRFELDDVAPLAPNLG
jgi:DNA-binding response OmpR family regulator